MGEVLPGETGEDWGAPKPQVDGRLSDDVSEPDGSVGPSSPSGRGRGPCPHPQHGSNPTVGGSESPGGWPESDIGGLSMRSLTRPSSSDGSRACRTPLPSVGSVEASPSMRSCRTGTAVTAGISRLGQSENKRAAS